MRSPVITGTPSPAKIRRFQNSDADAVHRILQGSPGAANWSRAGLAELARQPGTLTLISQAGTGITGFIIARQLADEAEVLNIAVSPKYRRAGHGSALLLAALAELHNRDIHRVFLEVRRSNAPAIAFYQKHGFVPIGSRKAYYHDPIEDALLMETKLTA